MSKILPFKIITRQLNLKDLCKTGIPISMTMSSRDLSLIISYNISIECSYTWSKAALVHSNELKFTVSTYRHILGSDLELISRSLRREQGRVITETSISANL